MDDFDTKLDKMIEIDAAMESTLINAKASLDKNTEDIADIRERMPKKKPASKTTSATKSSTAKKKES